MNPGGPGASGVEFVRDGAAAGAFPAALRKHFDIVGFDPRGVNTSTAVRCIDNLDGRAEIDPSPDTAAELKALVADARAYAEACAKRNQATLAYLSTDAVARDLDAIRSAIGDKQLTYLGFSYGTLIGSTYAELFPDHIRAMALDGAIDPALDLEQFRSGQAKGFEGALTAFLDDCAARTACTFHENGRTVQAFDALMASIDTKPLPALRINDPRRVGPGIAWYAVLAALYSKDAWPTLAASLALAKAGDGSLMLLIADPYRGRKANGSYSNAQDAYTANTCLDFAGPDGRRDLHEVGGRAEGDRPALRQDGGLQRPGLRLLAGAGGANARTRERGGRATDRGRRHDRRPGHSLPLGGSAGQGARLGRPDHSHGRGAHRVRGQHVRPAQRRPVPGRPDRAAQGPDLPVADRRLSFGQPSATSSTAPSTMRHARMPGWPVASCWSSASDTSR